MDVSESTALRPYLQTGEGLLWWGRPVQGFLLTPRDFLLAPFSLVWGGFAITWEAMTLMGDERPLFFVLWGVPFVLAGLYIMVGRFFHDSWKRSRMVYGVTSRRALILRGDKLTAIDLTPATQVRLSGGRDGARGTIVFGTDPSFPFFKWGVRHNTAGWTPSDAGTEFLRIEHAERVFNLIQSTRAKAAS